MKLQDVMHEDVPTISPDETATAAWERMRALGADHLVVTKGRDIIGIVSWYDLSGPLGGTHRRMGRRVGEDMLGILARGARSLPYAKERDT
jgi:CBS-domain-containing membrane protein